MYNTKKQKKENSMPAAQQKQENVPISPDQSAPQQKRVNVIFSQDQYEMLTQIAQKQNISISDALRQSIQIGKLVVDANQDADSRILLEKGGKVQELKLVR
jgi:hypothetical protein